MKINKHIVIVRTKIKRFSSMSQPSSDNLEHTLSKHYKKVSMHFLNSPDDLDSLLLLKPDAVFSGMKVVPSAVYPKPNNSPSIWLSEFLDQNDIASTGSGIFAHKLERNKAHAKQRILDSNLNSSKYFVANSRDLDEDQISELNFPLFVKPLDMGGGQGIDSLSVVNNYDQLASKVNQISLDYSSNSLVEEYLDGREFSVAVLKDSETGNYLSMPLELIAPKDEYGSRILSESIKSADSEEYSIIKDMDLKKELSNLAVEMFTALGARDYGRIDIRLNSKGVPQFLEANLIPSIIENFGNFPKAFKLNANIGYEDLMLRIVGLALSRENKKETVKSGLALISAI